MGGGTVATISCRTGARIALAAVLACAPVTHGRAAQDDASMTPSYVCVSDLELAIATSSPERAARAADVARREGELRLAELGLSTALTVTSGATLGADLAREREAALDPRLELDASFGYQYDAVAVARARGTLTTAVRRERAQERADTLQALLSLSRLRTAERLAARADTGAAEAERLAASAAASAAVAHAGSAHELPVDVVLDLRELDLAAARARATASGRESEAAAARAELRRLGIDARKMARTVGAPARLGPAACLSLPPGPEGRAAGPSLPRPVASASLARDLLVANAELAAAQRERAALGPLRDLSLTARYQEGGARLTAEVGLDRGRPGAGVAMRWRDSSAHAWELGVAATLRFDESQGRALAAADAQLEAVAAELDAFDAHFPERIDDALKAVDAAWLDLAFAIEAASIASGRLGLAEGERDVTRAEQVLDRSLDALEREYQAYLRALNRYLDEFDLPWSALFE